MRRESLTMMQLSKQRRHPSLLGQLIRLAWRIGTPINLIFISGSYEKQDLLPAEAQGRHRGGTGGEVKVAVEEGKCAIRAQYESNLSR